MSRNKKLEKQRPVSLPVAKSPFNTMRAPLIAFSLLIGLCVISSARSNEKSSTNTRANSSSNSVGVDVENFGKVTDFYYRGAQPKGEEYHQLANIGVKTIIDLRDDPRDFAKSLTEQAGMKYINLPLSDKEYPSADAPSKFLALVSDKENWPVYVHCAGGRHRTGAMTAVFRMTVQGWDINRAYEEMKN